MESLNLYNRAEVCELLRISPRNLYGMVKGNRFPAPERVGRIDYWSTAAIARWRETLFKEQEAYGMPKTNA